MTQCAFFCVGSTGQPGWFSALTPHWMTIHWQSVWPPTSPQQAWDPTWATWDRAAIAAKMQACGFVVVILDKEGKPHPGFSTELQVARGLWQEGALQAMTYIEAMRPSYVSHDAPASAATQVSLAIQSMPGASRTVISPQNLPHYLMRQWGPLLALAREEEGIQEDSVLSVAEEKAESAAGETSVGGAGDPSSSESS